MKRTINWKAGIWSAIVIAILGIVFFVLVGSQIDFSCKNATSVSGGCRVYNGINAVVQGYSDIWRSIFAGRCLGGNGPDDCLGPDAAIMLVTLLTIGFFGGGLLFRKKSNHDQALPQ